MKKTGRLDQILIRLGYCDEEQIKKALKRQRSQGGRLGNNLLALGVISEEQLLNALAEQFRVPILLPEERNLRPELVAKMPQDVVSAGHVLPLSWNEEKKVLSIATDNPGDLETQRRVKDAFGAESLKVALAPHSLLRSLVSKVVPGADAPPESKRILHPESFALDPSQTAGAVPPEDASGPPTARVLMVTSSVSRQTLLPPVFRKEGYELVVACSQWEAANALKAGSFERVLLSPEMAQSFAQWVRTDTFPTVNCEVVVFPSVSGALLDAPLGYDVTSGSLKSAVQALADVRAAQLGVSPPYGLVAADVDALGELLGLRRIARDGMHLGLHLLLPGTVAGTNGSGAYEAFAAFAASLELATRMSFPWKLDTLLMTCHALYSARVKLDAESERSEALLAAQIVSVAWFRHNYIEVRSGTAEERLIAVRSALRAQAGKLATASVIEAYVRLLTERGGAVDDVGDRQVMLVGGERLTRALTPALQRVGREPVATPALVEAHTLADRRAPAAIVIDHKDFPAEIEKFSRIARLGSSSLLFVLTDATDPALAVGLLDAGVDDVFFPPHDFDLVAARINRAIRSRSRDRGAEKPQSGHFSAKLEVFSLPDLIQMLGHGLKSVRVDLARQSNGDRAVIYMQKGRMIHAAMGEMKGEAAVYQALAWESDGEFTVSEETRFPTSTIQNPTETVLAEGLRMVNVMKQ